MSVVELTLTRDVSKHPGDGFVRFGISTQTSYLWAKKADGEGVKPIFDIKVGHGEESPGAGFEKLDINLTEKSGEKPAFIWFSRDEAHTFDGSPVVALKLVTGEDTAPGPGFEKLMNEINLAEADEDKKEYLCFVTQKAQHKVDNPEWKLNETLDVLDTADNWLVSTVIQLNPQKKTIKIHYEGWGSQWDEWLPIKHKRIAPLGTYTFGAVKGGLIPPWPVANNVGKFKRVIKKLTNIEDKLAKDEKLTETESNFLNQTDYKKFLLNVLNASIENDNDEHVGLVLNYFQANIRLIIRALKNDKDIPKWLQEVIQLIFDVPKSRFFGSHGTSKSAEEPKGKWASREHHKKEKSDKDPKEGDEPKLPSVYLVQLVNYFGDQGGFDVISKRFAERSDTDSFILFSSLLKLLANAKDVLEPDFARELVSSLTIRERVRKRVHSITDAELKSQGKEAFSSLVNDVQTLLLTHLEGKDIAEFAEKIKLDIALRLLQAEVLEKKLDGMNELHATIKKVVWKIQRENQKTFASEARSPVQSESDKAKTEASSSSTSSTSATSTTTTTDTSTTSSSSSGSSTSSTSSSSSSSSSSSRAGRARSGATTIDDDDEEFGPPLPSSHQGQGSGAEAPPEISKYLTPELLINWINDNKVVHIILSNHEQIIKKSPPVLNFLAQQKALTVEHIDTLWNAGLGKTEETTRIVYDALSELAQHLSSDQLDELFKRISSRPLDEYHDFDLTFLRTFTWGAVKATQGKDHWFGLEIFWQMVQDDSKVNDEIAKAAIGILKMLLEQDLFAKVRPVYLQKCLEGVDKNESVVPRMRVAQIILSILPFQSQQYPQSQAQQAQQQALEMKSQSDIILEADSKYHLIPLLLKDLMRYKSEAAAAAKKLKGPEQADPILVGRHSHSNQFNYRLQFLAFILQSSTLIIDKDGVDKLWSVFMENPVHSSDPKKLLIWLANQIKQHTRKRSYIGFDEDSRLYVFQGLLCGKLASEYPNLSVEGYECFETYFIFLNFHRQCLLSIFANLTIVQNYSDMIGMDSLWSIAALSRVPRVAEAARAFLTTLHVRLHFKLTPDQKKAIFKSFIGKCFAFAADAHKQYQEEKNQERAAEARRLVEALMDILSNFLFRIENGELIRTPRFSEGERVKATWKHQNTLYDAEVKRVNPDGTYYVVYDDGDEDDRTPERNLLKLLQEEETKEEPDDTPAFPSQLISNTKTYFDLLFELLGLGGELGTKVWSMLAKLPLNERLATTIKTLPDQTGPINWDAFLSAKSIIKLLYTLQIVDQYVSQVGQQQAPPPQQEEQSGVSLVEEDDEDEEAVRKDKPAGTELPPSSTSTPATSGSTSSTSTTTTTSTTTETQPLSPTSPTKKEKPVSSGKKWCEFFLNQGGLVHVHNILLTIDVEELSNGFLPQRCITVLLKLVHFFISGTSQTDPEIADKLLDHAKIVHKTLAILRGAVELKAKEILVKRKPQANERADQPNNAPQQLTEEAHWHSYLVGCTLRLLVCTVRRQPALMSIVHKYDQWNDILIHGLLNNPNHVTRYEIGNGIFEYCMGFQTIPTTIKPQPQHPRVVFLRLLLSILSQLSTDTNCMDYFEIVTRLLKDSNPDDGSYDVRSLTAELVAKLKLHPIVENSVKKNTDEMLCGLLALMKQLVAQTPELKEPLGVEYGLVEDILKCLFDVPTTETSRQENRPPKCKSPKSRKAAFALLSELAKGNEKILRTLLAEVSKNHFVSHSGGQKPGDWRFQASHEEKSSTGYVGIKNLGCICYMNACLQQLFMIPKVREGVLALDTSKEEDLKESLIYQTQWLMTFLQESEKQYSNPAGFCWAFKDFDGKPTNVTIQEDSGGFLSKLIDRINDKVKKTPFENLFKDTMGGYLSHELFGRNGCSHYREREEEFYAVQLELKNKKTLQESLEQFVQGEMLAGSNQYRCDQCGKKVDTLRRTCLKKLPPTIALIIKRFALDYTTFQTTKLNDKLVFPDTISFKPYSKDALGVPKEGDIGGVRSSGGDGKGSEGTAKEGGTKEEEGKDEKKETQDDAYWEYALRGMIIHTGTATHGHYYSFIKERPSDTESKWFEFNDTAVRDFLPKNIPEECYGGYEAAPSGYGQYSGYGSGGSGQQYEKSRSAYILFYDRIDKSDKCNPRERFPCPDRILSEVMQENLTYWRDKGVYDVSYYEFLWQLVENIKVDEIEETKATVVTPPPEPSKMTLLETVTELATRFVFFTLSRALQKDSLQKWMDLLKKLYKGNISMCSWLITQFMSPVTKWNRDFLLNCRDAQVQRGVSELICSVMSTVSPLEQKSYTLPIPEPKETKEDKDKDKDKDKEKKEEEPDTRGYLVQFIDSLIPLLREAPPFWKSFDPYFQVLAHFASLGKLEAQYLLRHNMLAKVLDFYLGDLSTHPEVNNIAIDKNGKRPVMGSNYEQPQMVNFLKLLRSLICASETPFAEEKTEKSELIPLSKAASDLLQFKDFGSILMGDAVSRKKGEQVVAIITHLAHDNKKLQSRLVTYALKEIEEKAYDKFRPYFRVLLGLVNLQDTIQDDRIDQILSGILTVMEQNNKYWKETDFCIEHLIRFAKLNDKVKVWLVAHADKLEWVPKWLEEHSTHPTGMDEHMELHKPSRIVTTYAQRAEALQHTGLAPLKKRILINLLRENKLADKDDAEDSDQDLENRVFKVGDQVDCRDGTDEWLCAQVIDVSGTRVHITYDGWGSEWNEWLDKADPRIQKYGTFTSEKQRAAVGKPQQKKRGAGQISSNIMRIFRSH